MRGRAAPPHPGIYRVPPGNYHMSIKKSQAILKHFVDLKFSVWFTLCPENETMFCDRTFSRSTADQDCQNTKWLAVYPASRVALIALRSFLDKSGKGKKERGKRKEERGKRGKRKLKKVLSVTKHGFVFWAQRKAKAKLEIYRAFQDRLTFLNRHMIV